MNYVYILKCADGTYYTGWTTDPERRVKVHNSGKGAKYTRSRLPVELLYTEEFDNKIDAQRREYEIKQLSHAEKDSLIKGQIIFRVAKVKKKPPVATPRSGWKKMIMEDDKVRHSIINLKYGNTNTFFIRGYKSGVLFDTDYAGTLLAFYKTIKQKGISVKDIEYILASHYHPDHMGLISELMAQGVKLLLVDVQKDFVHYSDHIFARDKISYRPIDEAMATVISCEESRAFLSDVGIHGEVVHTPSHSEDSISLILDDGNSFVGDLEPFEYIEAYNDNAALKNDWERILSLGPKRVFYAHRPEKVLEK